jgi:hypothetical protein
VPKSLKGQLTGKTKFLTVSLLKSIMPELVIVAFGEMRVHADTHKHGACKKIENDPIARGE